MNLADKNPAEAATLAAQPSVRLGRRLREVRLERSFSVRSLAEEAGFSPSFISQVETGQASPSIGSLDRIARVLEVSLSDLFAEPPAGTVVIRAGTRPEINSAWSRARIESLTESDSAGVEGILITLRGGGGSGMGLHAAAAAQLAFVVHGAVVLHLGEVQYDVRAGDAATIPAGAPHRWENPGIDAAEFILIKVLAVSHGRAR